MRFKQIYHPYFIWEDYLNGMYSTANIENENDLINSGILLFCDKNLFYDTALEMILTWKISADVNLTNVHINRRAWIGRASCNFLFGMPEIISRISWQNTPDKNKNIANNIANKIIRIYEEKNKSLYKNMGTEVLF